MNYKKTLMLACVIMLMMVSSAFAIDKEKNFMITDDSKEQYLLLTSIIGRENTRLFDPNGIEIIISEENSTISMTEEGNLFILLPNPHIGEYKIITNENTKSLVYDEETKETSVIVGGEVNVALIEQYISPRFNILSAQMNNSVRILTVKFSEKYGADATETTVDLMLVHDENSSVGDIIAHDIPISEGSYTYEVPDDINTGTYYIKGFITRVKDDEVIGTDTKTSDGFKILNRNAPDKVTGLKVNNIGNEQIKFTWDKLSKTPDKYYISITNIDGVSQYLEADGIKNSIESSDFSNGSYTAGIYAVNVIEDIEYIGDKDEDIDFAVFPPAPPEVIFDFTSNGKVTTNSSTNLSDTTLDTYLVNDGSLFIKGVSDRNAKIEILLNEEYMKTLDDVVEFNYSFDDLVDGSYDIEVIATSDSQDMEVCKFKFVVDTVKPYLEVLSPINGDAITDGFISVKGQCEPATDLKVNGITVPMDSDGFYDYKLLPTYSLDNVVTVIAADLAGNKTEYVASLVNDTHEIKSYAIRSEYESMYDDMTGLIYVVAIDVLNQENIISSNVTYEIISGKDVASIGEDGTLKAIKAGTVTVKGTFQLNDDKVFEDEVTIDIIEKPKKKHERDEDSDESVNIKDYLGHNYTLKINHEKGDIFNILNYAIVKIPPNAINENIRLEAKILDKKALDLFEYTGDKEIESYILDIESSGSHIFENPINISFNIDIDEKHKENYAIYYYNENLKKWLYIGGNYEDGKLTAKVGHLTKFAVFYNEELIQLNDIENHWAKDYVQTLVGKNIINGVKNTNDSYSFLPNKDITRAEFAKLVTVMKGYDIVNEYDGNIADYNDIKTWAMPYMQTLLNEGIIKGSIIDGKRYLYPNQKITRQEIVTIMSRIYDYETKTTFDFKDDDQISLWAKEHLTKMIELGVVGGYPDNTFRPKNYATRGECAKIIYKMMELIEIE